MNTKTVTQALLDSCSFLCSNSLRLQYMSIAFFFFCTSCYQTSDYSGDGKFIDAGVFAATDRYILDLGKIDFKQKGTFNFKFRNLPQDSFVVGFEICSSKANREVLEIQDKLNAKVLISLKESSGTVVFLHESLLKAWTWSVPSTGESAFVYVRGTPGSEFTPKPDTGYQLNIAVLEPDSSKMDYESKLLAKSGGWK